MSNEIHGTSVPSEHHKRHFHPTESSSATSENSIVEILSDDEPEIIDLDNEPEVVPEEGDSTVSNGEIEIVGVNTENPTPISRRINPNRELFVEDDDEETNADDIEITNVRHIENNHHTVHTPFGHFRVFMPDMRRTVQAQQPSGTVTRNLYRLARPTPQPQQQLSFAQLARNQQRQRSNVQTRRQSQRQLQRQRQQSQQLQQQVSQHFIQSPHFREMFAYLPFRQQQPHLYQEDDELEMQYIQNVLNAFGDPDFDSNGVEESILRRIERDNERELNQRLQRETMYNNKTLQEKKQLADSNIETNHTTMIKLDVNLVCELCGIVLGEGIPEDFLGDSGYNDNFEKFTKQYQVQAPWFCSYPMTIVDKELSKRIFVAKCGHTFCGRCVKNIGNRPRRTKFTKSGLTILNPSIFAPSKCPESICIKKFTGKSFTELYF